MTYSNKDAVGKVRADVLGLLLSLVMAAQVAWVFSTRVEIPYVESRLALQEQILQGSAEEPYRFRVLVPIIASSLEELLAQFDMGAHQSHQLAFLVINFTAITGTFWLT